jgi:hypothetical protein
MAVFPTPPLRLTHESTMGPSLMVKPPNRHSAAMCHRLDTRTATSPGDGSLGQVGPEGRDSQATISAFRKTVRPFVGIYLGIMGFVILWRAFRRRYGAPTEERGALPDPRLLAHAGERDRLRVERAEAFSAGASADQVRAHLQSEDSQSARPHDPDLPHRPSPEEVVRMREKVKPVVGKDTNEVGEAQVKELYAEIDKVRGQN